MDSGKIGFNRAIQKFKANTDGAEKATSQDSAASNRARYSQTSIDAVKISFSIRAVLKKIGVRPTGGNYQVAYRRIKLLKLDTSHFTGQGYLKGKSHNWGKKIPTEDILVKNSLYGGATHKFKLRLIKEKYLKN